MRRLLVIFTCSAALFSSAQSNQTTKAVKQYTIAQFYKTVNYGGGAFQQQEQKILVQQNATGIYNIYEIDLNTGTERQLTKSEKESFFAVSYVPGADHFIYAADKGGNENTHLYLQSADGSVKDLTSGEKEKAGFRNWNREKTAFYYNSNVRDPQFFDVYKMNIVDWTPKLIYKNEKGLDVDAMSPDERYLLLTKSITTDKNEMYLLDTKTNDLKKISKEGEEATYQPQTFELDNSAFYYITNEGNEFSYLVKYDLLNGTKQKLYGAPWDVSYFYISEKGKYHVIGINEDGRGKVLMFDHKSNSELPFPVVKDGSVSGVNISPSEENMVLYAAGDKSPVNLWYYNFASKGLKKLTNALNPEIDPEDLVNAEIVRFKSFDGLSIPAIFYKPLSASPTAKVPAIVMVHGGPGGQSRAGYSQLTQYLVNHGYAVLAVNNRGSSGYGKTFYKMDNRNHGDKDLKDCVWGKKWLEQQSYIMPGKIAILGGSYGGFMSLAGIIQYPDQFTAGVDLFGVTNWVRTLRSIPPYWESFKQALYDEMGDPNSADSVRLKNVSPLYNTNKIKTPLLVFQGANDPRVLKVESDEIVEGAKKNGSPVEYVVFPDEGHGFVKKENQIKTAETTLQFLDKYLRSGTGAAAKKAF
jgi:dipeptidyl aminopeptidase/acylaminoacyl peptidase